MHEPFCRRSSAGARRSYESACALIGESLGIAGELNDEWGVGICLNALAVITRDRGNIADSRKFFEQSLAV